MKLDYSKTLNEQGAAIENILNENKHYSLQLSQLQQEKEELIKYLNKRIKKLNSEYTVEKFARLELIDVLSKLKESDKNGM